MPDLPQKTLLLLQREQQVLLARKKMGFGAGKIVAVGGGVEPGETVLAAALRETQEEVGVLPLEPRQVAELRFHFPAELAWSMAVSVFSCFVWHGEPCESSEVVPAWYPVASLPFDEMWLDARYWLPDVLAGNFVTADFVYKDAAQLDLEVSCVQLNSEESAAPRSGDGMG